MTEVDVLDKLTKFKDKLIKFRDERNTARDELESLKEDLLKKEQIIFGLTNERNQSLSELDTIHSSFDNLQGLYELKNQAFTDLKSKTLQTLKHLVEDVIETDDTKIQTLNNKIIEIETQLSLVNEQLKEKNSTINEKESEVSDLRGQVEKQKLRIEDFEENYIKKEQHSEEINQILTEKSKSDEEKQTVLSNTWKEQVKTNNELRDALSRIDELQINLSEEREKNGNLKASLDLKSSELDNFKTVSNMRIKELEQDAQKIDNDTKLEITRLTERVKSLNATKTELENTNKELVHRIKILEDKLVNYKTETKPANIQERSVISKETIPYKFGSTTASVMQKAKNFIEELYKDSAPVNGVYSLNNPSIASTTVGLSEKEYTVFMNRLSECLEYDGVPLLYQDNGTWKSNLSKMKLIDFISAISGK